MLSARALSAYGPSHRAAIAVFVMGAALLVWVGRRQTDTQARPGGDHNMALLFAGFMLFYFMTNLGPNAMTYLHAGEVFPTRIRGKGAGFAASDAKIGAVMTAFLFPILLEDIGTSMLLYLLVGASVLGAAVTIFFGIETKGLNLEKIGDPKARQTPRQKTHGRRPNRLSLLGNGSGSPVSGIPQGRSHLPRRRRGHIRKMGRLQRNTRGRMHERPVHNVCEWERKSGKATACATRSGAGRPRSVTVY